MQAYEAIHQAAPTAQIYVLSYPPLFHYDATQSSCDYIDESDIQWLMAKESQLNSVVQQAVADAGPSVDGFIHYVDDTGAFAGHEMCSGGTEWFNGIDADSVNAFPIHPEYYFHPNALGQQAMAAVLSAAVNANPLH